MKVQQCCCIKLPLPPSRLNSEFQFQLVNPPPPLRPEAGMTDRVGQTVNTIPTQGGCNCRKLFLARAIFL